MRFGRREERRGDSSVLLQSSILFHFDDSIVVASFESANAQPSFVTGRYFHFYHSGRKYNDLSCGIEKMKRSLYFLSQAGGGGRSPFTKTIGAIIKIGVAKVGRKFFFTA